MSTYTLQAQSCPPPDPLDILNPITHEPDCFINSGDCTSNDLQLVGAFLDVGETCNTCNEGEQITAELFLSINNITGSTRTSFAIFGSLEVVAPDGTTILCPISRCTGTIPPNQITTLSYGSITFTCGEELTLKDMVLSWTDASPNSTCQNHDCKEISPKCGSVDEIVITPPLNAIATAECNTDNTADVDLKVMGGQTPFTFSWTGPGGFTASTEDISSVVPGTYTVSVMDANSCMSTTTVIVPECFVCPTLDNESPDINVCIDDQNKTVSVDTDVDDIDIEFVWYTTAQADPYAGGTQIGTAVTPTGGTATSNAGINFATAGTYYAYAILDTDDPDLTDPNCRPFTEIIITIDEQLDAGEDGAIALCEGADAPTETELFAALGGSPDMNGVWSGPDAAGVYTYTHEATATCPEDTTTVTVTYDDAPVAGDNGSIALCEGADAPTETELFAALGGSPDMNGVWSGPDAAGVYTYTHEATATCPEDTATVTVTFEETLEAGEDGAIVLCEGADAPTEAELFAALGGSPDMNGVWSGPDAAGVYTYTHAATATCPEDTATVTVTYEDALDAGEDGSIALCEGADAPTEAELFAALGGSPDMNGVWSGPDAAGVYTYTHAATATCPEDTATVTVTYEDALDAGEDGSIALCEGADAPTETELFAALGGTPDMGGTWSGPDAAGVYTYTHAATATCPEDTTTVTVTYEDAPDAGEDGSIALCEGADAPTEAELFAALGGTPDMGGTWSGPDAAGVYTYTHEATATCPEDTATVTVTFEETLEAGEDGSIALCEGAVVPTETELFAALGGSPDMGGTWSGPDAAGVYTYTHEAAATCPEDTATVTVTFEETLEAGEDGAIALCEGADAPTETELFAALGGSPDMNGVWSGPDAAGVYTYTHAATATCPEDTATVTVTFEETLEAGEDGAIALCEGADAPTETELFAALGGSPDMNGVWSGPDAAGVYTYTHEATATCPEDTATVTVTFEETLEAGEDGAIALCEGADAPTETELFAALGGSPDMGGTWSGPDADGVYTYTHEATATCSEDTATVTVTYEDVLEAGDNGSIALCEGADAPTETELFAALGGSPDMNGVWSGPDAAGVYAYTHEATATCPEDTATVTVTYEDVLEAGDNGSIALCEGADAPTEAELFAALGGSPDMNGVWSGPDTAGVYTYTHEATATCPEDTATVTVTFEETLEAGEDGAIALCEGADVPTETELFAALGGSPDMGGTWSGPDAAGVYTYTHEATATCPEDTATVTVTFEETLEAGEDGAIALCEGADVPTETELFAALGGSPDMGGTWSGPDAAGVYTYTHEAAATCPEDTATVTVTFEETLEAGEDGAIALCEGADAPTETELFAALGGSPDMGGTWSGPDAAGVYTYTHEATATCPEDTATVTVTFEETLEAGEDGAIVLCEGADAPTETELFAALGGTPDMGGTWSGPDAAGVYAYTHEATATCPEDTATVTVTYDDAPTAGADNEITVCDGAIVDLTSLVTIMGGTFSETVISGGLNGSDFDTAGLSPDSYEIIYTVGGGVTCPEDTAAIIINVNEPVNAGANNSLSVCEGTIVDLSALVTQDGGMFSTTNGGTINGNEFDTSGLSPGDYIVEYVVAGDGVCPDDKALITISVAEDVIVQTCEAVDATFCGDGTTKYNFYWFGSNASSGGSNFFGSDAMNNLSFTEFNDGTALVQGTTVLGSCTAELYIKLVGKTDWEGWQLQDGTFKNMGCTNPDPAALHYYVIDNSVSTITTIGGDCLEEGTFIVSQKPDPNDPLTPHLGVIVGPGGVLHGLNPSANGIAGWGFMGPENDPKKYDIDFNFELDCKDATGCDFDEEICDGIDNDGDGQIDEGFDADNDGTPDCADVEECDGLDNDGDLLVDEGFDSDMDGIADCFDEEVCDGKDNDGDGEIDEGLSCGVIELCDGVDNDGDGDVDEGFEDTDNDGIADCVDPCDNRFDADGDGIPDCEDVEECDGLDNNGDGVVDEGFADTDGDGTADCQDIEECDGVDNDGDGDIDEGFDSDMDGIADCNDEEECDGVDNDGDGDIDEGFADTDGDGTADCIDQEECDGIDNDGDGEIDEGLDCEEVCDGIDNDGDGEIDEGLDCEEVCDGIDNDGDGEIDEGLDCEEVCDGIDNDGDGEIDEGLDCEEVCDGIDNDGDGEIDEGLDCEEVCDGIDNDGDGEIDEGLDCTNCDDFVVTTESVTNEKCPGDGKGKIRLGVTGGKPNYTFSWSHDSDEKSRNPVQLSAGTYTVTVTDSNGCEVQHTIEVGLDSDTCKGGKKVTSTTVKAFPMTFKNELNLSIDIPYDTNLKVEMFDANGRCVMAKDGMNLKSGTNEVELNLSNIAPDVYILILSTHKERILKKVMSRK